MKSNVIRAALVAAFALVTTGCSSFKMGGACYVPYGVTGSCSVQTAAPDTLRPE